MTARSRMIFLTDKIIADFPEGELLAVFFHEAGHVKKHHLQLYLVLFFTLAGLMHLASEHLFLAGLSEPMIILLQLAVLWFVLLGFVSRRFEREADLYGAEHAAVLEPDPAFVVVPGLPTPLPRGAARMVGALDRLLRFTGGRAPSHRHGRLEPLPRGAACRITR